MGRLILMREGGDPPASLSRRKSAQIKPIMEAGETLPMAENASPPIQPRLGCRVAMEDAECLSRTFWPPRIDTSI